MQFSVLAMSMAMVFLSALSAAAEEPRTLVVAQDGSGEFRTVQSAVDAIPAGRSSSAVIRIRPGVYKEKLRVPRDRRFLTLRGDDAAKTVLTFDWNARHPGPNGREVGTGGSWSVRVEANDFVAENLTIENTAGDTGQAVALAAVGDRQVFRHCRLLGWQDTLYADNGRQLYDRCYIEGRVDFIFGSATAVFDHCHLHSKDGGHVTAASTPADREWGFVFLDCKLTGDSVPWREGAPPATQPTPASANADLGRPWRPHAAVAFVRCEIGPHIRAEGWDNWRNPENETTARFYEFRCTGPGADRSKRVKWSRVLSEERAEQLTAVRVLSGEDAWSPSGS